MRLLLIIFVVTCLTACAAKPEYLIQTPTGLKVGLDRATDSIFSLVDKDKHVISKTKSSERTLLFALQPDTTPNNCYAIFDDKGNPLLEKNIGVKITAADDYHQQHTQLLETKRQLSQCRDDKQNASKRLEKIDIELKNSPLYTGDQCKLPVQREIPAHQEQLSFPKTVCKDFVHCEKPSTNPCTNNFAQAEPCRTVETEKDEQRDITRDNFNEAIPTLKKEDFAISTQVLESLTECKYHHTTELLDAENYEDFFFTILLKGDETDAQMQRCIEQFIQAASIPLEKWEKAKKTIDSEPDSYLAVKQCQSLLDNHNTTLETINTNDICIRESRYRVAVLTQSINTLAQTKSEPQLCDF